MNIRFSGVHVTLVISPTDLRGGFHRLCSLAQDVNVLCPKFFI